MSKEELIKLGVSCETISKLDNYVEFLLKWNKKINLISQNTVSNIWIRHIVDSAQLIKFLKNTSTTIIDLGAGAGLPGIVLSILGIEKIILIESDAKKASFLKEVSMILNLNVEIINDRVENVRVKGDILIARGFSTLDKILATTLVNIRCNRILLLKGEKAKAEIILAQQSWEFDCKKHRSITNLESHILDITNVHKKRN